ncbi:MAG: hypothetical protein IKV03_01630 [Alphaproteobacteria bacterium]|nr:hypothetical protein [Alphaproteobacteria bacterium]
MEFIHNRDKNSISIMNAERQLILKISGFPLLSFKQRNGWFLACGKETMRIDINSHENNGVSLDVFYDKKHILSFMSETPERSAYLAIYEELPSLIVIPQKSEIQKNKWFFMDYRSQLEEDGASKKNRPRKIKHIMRPIKDCKKARFREL